MTDNSEQQTHKLLLELRRGTLVLAVLAQLRQEHYGYSLRKALQDRGIDIDESTLYPLIRRLEQQGLLASEWRIENKRKKRFYCLSNDGLIVLNQLSKEWLKLNKNLQTIILES